MWQSNSFAPDIACRGRKRFAAPAVVPVAVLACDMTAMRHTLIAFLAVLAAAGCGALPEPLTAAQSFAARIDALSEPGGYFDTDNLISNERSYLHALDDLRALQVRGGAYLGVGPDQNFSYIAELRPGVAYIVDIRRDNMLVHLLFKALFTLSERRIEYLSLLFGRAPPERPDEWRSTGVRALAEHIDRTPATPEAANEARRAVDRAIVRFGVSLSDADRTTIDRFHRTFMRASLDLRFQSAGRPPRFYYPTYRELLLETDRHGEQGHYLASEARYQIVRALQLTDRVVPVVGDLAGEHALAAIDRALRQQGQRVSAFYTSNVEYYLFQQARYRRFLDNLARLPHADHSVVIRSVFANTAGRVPGKTMPGYFSTSLVQPVPDLLDGFATGRYASYWDLIR